VKQGLVAFTSGLLFAAGLAISGMTLPTKVVGFLDVGGNWDPSLAFVMLGAIAVNAVGWVVARRRAAAATGPAIPSTASPKLDGALLGGAALFGIGWGISGFCPGPGLESVFVGNRAALVFVPAMLAGMGLYRLAVRRRVARDETGRAEANASACAS
jgi:uncharacterized membrane protein YedE/YeeE